MGSVSVQPPAAHASRWKAKMKFVSVQGKTEDQTPLSACSVCDEIFQPSDDMDFVCRDCQSLLVDRCDCGSDDVHMDWGVEVDSELPYYWIIECYCGRTMKSRLHSINDINIVAKELHKSWCYAFQQSVHLTRVRLRLKNVFSNN